MGYCSGYDIKSYFFNFIVRVVAVFPSHPLDGINQPENISFNTHNTCFYKNRMSTNSLLDLAKNLSPTRAPTPSFISYFLLNRYFRRLSIIYPKLMKPFKFDHLKGWRLLLLMKNTLLNRFCIRLAQGVFIIMHRLQKPFKHKIILDLTVD